MIKERIGEVNVLWQWGNDDGHPEKGNALREQEGCDPQLLSYWKSPLHYCVSCCHFTWRVPPDQSLRNDNRDGWNTKNNVCSDRIRGIYYTSGVECIVYVKIHVFS